MLNRTVSLSVKFHQLPDDTCRLLATWTIAQLDVNGVFYADPAIVRALIFPMREDITTAQVGGYIKAMVKAGLIRLFESGGRHWQVWDGFTDNQIGLRADRESSDFPQPPEDAGVNPDYAGNLPEDCRIDAAKIPAEVEVEVEKEVKENVKGTHKPHDPLLENPSVIAYRDIMKLTPNDLQRKLIVEHITDQVKWRASLEDWLAHGWSPKNIPGMIERYESPPASNNGKREPDKTRFYKRGVTRRPQVEDATGPELEAARERARQRIAERAKRKEVGDV